ncbi:hypothetical protein [Paraburkholderia mimosarum]|uniref:hypothetical protein n=2 Tax=Paraburkholderia TaxID=1822464 RepID=UPI000687F354|nr:hypothetical protein [Paraburkholderia mimosarum]
MNAKSRALPSALALTGTLAATLLISGCLSSPRVATAPARPTTVAAAPPPPQPVVVAQPVYVPQPYDAYVAVVLDRDVVYAGGSTYIWITDPEGRRQRRYYGRGDLRGEVLHRRAELRVVMAHNQGHLPMQHARAPEPQRVRVTMQPPGTPPHAAQPHGSRPPPGGRPPAHTAQHRPPPAPGRKADANANANANAGHHHHPDSHPNAAPSPRFAGQPPHAG